MLLYFQPFQNMPLKAKPNALLTVIRAAGETRRPEISNGDWQPWPGDQQIYPTRHLAPLLDTLTLTYLTRDQGMKQSTPILLEGLKFVSYNS